MQPPRKSVKIVAGNLILGLRNAMDVTRWLLRQEPKWQRLEALVSQAEQRSIKSLSAAELQELSSLYRMVTSDLSRSRTRKFGTGITEYLQRLALRAYTQVYQGRQRQELREIWRFFIQTFPAIFRDTWGYTAVSTLVFLFGALIGWWYAWRDPVFLDAAIPAHIIEKVRDEGELWMGSIVGVEPLASSYIMVNNISVTLAAFVGGIALLIGSLPLIAGIGTLFILWNNGLHIGSIATLVGQHNLAYPFWAFVFPHGALELPAIFLSGGAGLLLAKGIVFPGRIKRLQALKANGLKAIQLMFGVVPMLVIAGLIEGFFSPNPSVPDSAKYLAGMVLFSLLMFYLTVGAVFKLEPIETSPS